MHQRTHHLDTLCQSYEVKIKVIFDRSYSEIVSSTYIHIDFGRCSHSDDGIFSQGAILGVLTFNLTSGGEPMVGYKLWLPCMN